MFRDLKFRNFDRVLIGNSDGAGWHKGRIGIVINNDLEYRDIHLRFLNGATSWFHPNIVTLISRKQAKKHAIQQS